MIMEALEQQGMLLEPVNPESLRLALRRVASTVHVIAVKCRDGRFFATTATAVVSVSFDPPRLLICLNRTSAIARAILEEDVFTISALSAGQQRVAMDCAGGVAHEEREALFDLSSTVRNAPLLNDAQSTLTCRRADAAIHGTHVIVWGEPIEAASKAEVEPLIYLDGAYGGFRPN